MNNNEQWKTEGNCNMCRRQEYCKKVCKAHQNRAKQFIKQAVEDKIRDVYSGKYTK